VGRRHSFLRRIVVSALACDVWWVHSVAALR
jgi:hypothetical protein